jgi:hypothetical protein
MSQPAFDLGMEGGRTFEPVMIEHEREHAWPRGTPKGKRCAECKRGKHTLPHLGYPESINVGGSGSDWFAWQNAKKMWQARFAELLEVSGLVRGLERVMVEGLICFPDRRARDQGNLRYPLEKFLGDALVNGGGFVDGGWLRDDLWPRYQFGNLEACYEPGRAFVRLTLFPDDRLVGEWPPALGA